MSRSSFRFFSHSHVKHLLRFGGVAGFAYCSTVIAPTGPAADTTVNAFPSHVQDVISSVNYPAPLPDVQIARKISSKVDTSHLGLRLYQYQTCPFCCKVRTALHYYGFAYEVVEVNPVTRAQLKPFAMEIPSMKVPMMVSRGESNKVFRESSLIVSLLRSFMVNHSNKSLTDLADFYPELEMEVTEAKVQSMLQSIRGAEIESVNKVVRSIPNKYDIMEESGGQDKAYYDEQRTVRKWRQWVDTELVHMLSPNIYRSFSEAFAAFRYFSEVGDWENLFGSWERRMVIYVGAILMYFIGRRLKKRHNLRDDVRRDLYHSCNKWVKAVQLRNTSFHGGERPDLADLEVFAVLSSIEGCDAFKDMIENTGIGPWFYLMKRAVEERWGESELKLALERPLSDLDDQKSKGWFSWLW